MRFRTVIGLIIVCGFAAAGCSAGDVVAATPLPGDYQLVAVGGNPLPATVVWPGGPRTFVGGRLSLGADQRFDEATDVQVCRDGACTVETAAVHGTWSVLPDGSLYFDGDAGHSTPPPLVLADERRITFCAGAAGQPCAPERVFERP